jgi:[protein-PII] uridylyltransferase
MEVTRSDTPYRDIMHYIEFELTQQITLAKPIHLISSGRVNRQLKHFPIHCKVNIEKDNRGMHMLSLIAGDRPGLLARIAQILDRHEMRLHRAKINTLGGRAEDVFWISGATLNDPSQTAVFLNELLEKL